MGHEPRRPSGGRCSGDGGRGRGAREFAGKWTTIPVPPFSSSSSGSTSRTARSGHTSTLAPITSQPTYDPFPPSGRRDRPRTGPARAARPRRARLLHHREPPDADRATRHRTMIDVIVVNVFYVLGPGAGRVPLVTRTRACGGARLSGLASRPAGWGRNTDGTGSPWGC